ncbi:KUP/HAK/KT family potassium transporter [Pedobacter cryoconitis]|uniref:Probable potassium transport system protein Kup n=1 Tax=Pedobacter cryoconitis TaxID=188932 RepID=A0A7X0MJC9_9SPHI|nr:KUP/HAK/KT family potassium transporter [Pedobacter cryoconitis]MBB6501347.1 KUP system potassium uptake protein [Pedobacter cryoconitis]
MSTIAQTSIRKFQSQVKLAGILIATGIVFGDIGTSPLYTYTAIFQPGEVIDSMKALGILSCIIWTLTLQTTVKYILITLQADNNGEGGIFSLYTLIRRYYGKWVVILAILGGSFLISDGIITPPISVASAVEGLKLYYPHLNTIPIVITILVFLFVIQQFGTQVIGKIFGPVMILWFAFMGIIGFMALSKDFTVLKALNPVYAFNFLLHYPKGFWLLGGVFLCTTGAEALYSDMGHVGRNNIRVSWIFIKIALILSYAGQTAWLLSAGKANNLSPFFNIVPLPIYIPAVVLSTLATIIASQALISGCFTLANEAIHLGLWPRHKIIFPGNIKGQLYIPFFNWALMAACISVVLYFRESTKMEAAFGLSVTLTMLSTTCLIVLYMLSRRRSLAIIIPVTIMFLTVEISFLIANLKKIAEGGWIMLIMGTTLSAIMLIWRWGRGTEEKLTTYSEWEPDNLKRLVGLSHGERIENFSTHLIYITSSPWPQRIEDKTLNSIFTSPLKKADIYWFFHISITDEPYTLQYKINTLSSNDAYFVDLKLGFRVPPRVDLFFRKIAQELIKSGELDREYREDLKFEQNPIGGYKFIVISSFLSFDNQLPFWKNFLIRIYYNIKGVAVTQDDNYGLDPSNVIFEKYPLVYTSADHIRLERIK